MHAALSINVGQASYKLSDAPKKTAAVDVADGYYTLLTQAKMDKDAEDAQKTAENTVI